MKTKLALSNHKVLLVSICTGLLLMLFVTAVAAATTTIDTNNGVVDANWGNVSMLRDDPDDDSAYPTDVEIDKVWVANNSALNTFYFRVDSLVQLPNTELLVAKLDCNRNSSYADAVDVAVLFDPYTGTAFECQGDTYNTTCYHDAPEDDNGVGAAELISAGGVYTYEWYGATAGTVDWAACLGTISVQFAGVYYSDYAEDDSTEARDYNAPTAIQLQQFSATTSIDSWSTAILVAIGSLLVTGMWLLRRFYNRPS